MFVILPRCAPAYCSRPVALLQHVAHAAKRLRRCCVTVAVQTRRLEGGDVSIVPGCRGLAIYCCPFPDQLIDTVDSTGIALVGHRQLRVRDAALCARRRRS